MVSFQCDACQDVVKKPKLDTHSYKCHASFTCVDCSKTFQTRSEWKGHISCISEAEKYQKGLYKGKKTQQNGPASLGADKSDSSGKERSNKSITVRSQPTSGNRVESNRRDTSDTVVNNGNPATMISGPAADMQAKETSKKNSKADGSHLDPTGDASMSDSKTKRKKRKLDAANTNRQTETAQDDASKTAVSSSADMAPQVPETKTLEKEKKDRKDKKRWKRKKDKEKPVSDVEKEDPIAPSATDPRPPALNDRQESDNPLSKKKFKKSSNPFEYVSEESVPCPTDEAGTQAAVKKKKKSKGEHKDGTASNVKKDNGAAPEHTTPDKKRKQSDETGDDDDAVSAKKAKKAKERKKERKRKARNDAQPVENP